MALTYLILQHTLWGRYTYALGSNLQAAVVSGIKINRYLILVYTFAGFLAAVAAIVLTARIGSGQPGLGLGYELDAIAASVIGGTSLAGGLGSAGGTLIGALIIGVMKNGLDILNVSADFQQVARAIIIVVAVTIDVRKNVRRTWTCAHAGRASGSSGTRCSFLSAAASASAAHLLHVGGERLEGDVPRVSQGHASASICSLLDILSAAETSTRCSSRYFSFGYARFHAGHVDEARCETANAASMSFSVSGPR